MASIQVPRHMEGSGTYCERSAGKGSIFAAR